jgi:hypothetical protein
MIPNRIPDEAWDEFVKMRIKLKKPMTEYAKKLMLSRLAMMMQAGQDPEAVLNQSIMNGWTNIYEVKQEQRMVSNGRPMLALVDVQRANSEEASRMIGNEDWRTIDETR